MASWCLLSGNDFWFQYNFQGRYDLVRFIKTVHKAGLYAHLRIGPYVCAEWNYGYPFILYFFSSLDLCFLFSTISTGVSQFGSSMFQASVSGQTINHSRFPYPQIYSYVTHSTFVYASQHHSILWCSLQCKGLHKWLFRWWKMNHSMSHRVVP